MSIARCSTTWASTRVEVREPRELDAVDVLFLPGGESTTMSRLLGHLGPARRRSAPGSPRACPPSARVPGLILLAREVVDGRPDQQSLGVLDVAARRNAVRSTSSSRSRRRSRSTGLRGGPFPGVFIRAPGVDAVGPDVEVLASHDGRPVLVRQGTVWASTFHPELARDLRIHEWFLREVEMQRVGGRASEGGQP